jgi:hypothetical protein
MIEVGRLAYAAIAAFGALGSAQVHAQLPTPSAEKMLRQGGIPITQDLIQEDAAELMSALSPDQRRRLGAVQVRLEKGVGPEPCAKGLRLAGSVHAAGKTVITVCERALNVFIDNATVAAVFPFLGTLSAENLYTQSRQINDYTILLLRSAFQNPQQASLRYCSPYVYLASIAAKPSADPDCNVRIVAPERNVIEAVDRSALASSMMAVNARMKFVSEDMRPSQFVALNLVLLVRTSLNFLLAHEMGHHLCTSRCDEDQIDRFAIDLMARSPVSGGYMANFQAAQAVVFFSSLFSDDDALLFRAPMDQATLRRKVMKRQASAACEGARQLKAVEENNRDAFKAFEREAKKEGGIVEALADTNLALVKFMLAVQCGAGS